MNATSARAHEPDEFSAPEWPACLGADLAIAADLARWRAETPFDDEQLRLLFGVGAATLERIEAGEVMPGDELEARIRKVIYAGLTGSDAARAGRGTESGPSRAAVLGRGVGDPPTASPHFTASPRGAWLAEQGGSWAIWVRFDDGTAREISIADARRLVDLLEPLVAAHDASFPLNQKKKEPS